MKTLLPLAASLGALALTSVAQAVPRADEVYIRNVIAGGPGCPQGTYSTLVTSTDPSSNRADFFEIIFDEFLVEKGRGVTLSESRKHCTVAVDMHFPQGWQFSILDVHYQGFADIPSRNMGILTTQYSFPHFSNPVSTTKRLYGPFAGDYRKEDTLGIFSRVWSPCGMNIPLNMKSTLWVRGPRDDAAFMTVDQQTGLLVQRWGISWRRCR